MAWTEAVRLVAASRVPDALAEEVRRQFRDEELLALTLAVVTLNAFNRRRRGAGGRRLRGHRGSPAGCAFTLVTPGLRSRRGRRAARR